MSNSSGSGAATPDMSTARTGLRLAGAAIACLAAAGLLLWWQQGEAIFGQYLVGALAWCF